MSSLIALVFAGLQTTAAPAAEPGVVVCDLIASGRRMERRGPTALDVSCPEGFDGLQAFASERVAAIDLDFDRSRWDLFEVAASVHVRRLPSGEWTVDPGQLVVSKRLMFPVRGVERGARHMVCATAIEPDRQGVPQNPHAECLSEVPRINDLLASAVEQTYRNWRYLPSDIAYCIDEQSHTTATAIDRTTGEESGPGPMPDPAGLPNLCE